MQTAHPFSPVFASVLMVSAMAIIGVVDNFVIRLAGALGLAVFSIFSVVESVGPTGFVTRGWVWPMEAALPWVALQAVGFTAAVFMLIKAYQLGEPSYVAVFEYSVMIFGPLFAWVVMGQGIGPLQIAGIALIAVAGAVLAWRASVVPRREPVQ